MNLTTPAFNAEVVTACSVTPLLYTRTSPWQLRNYAQRRIDFGRLFIISTFITTLPSIPWFSRLLFPSSFVASVIQPRTKLTLN